MTLVVLVVAFLYSPVLAAIAVAAIALYALVRWAWYRPLRRATEEQIVHAAKQESHFFETARGIRSIKLFGRRHERREAWLALLVDQLNAGLKAQRLTRSEEHTSELQSRENLVCRLLLEKTKIRHGTHRHS